MRLLGLTGGIGSGKSSVSERLLARGAQILDADAIVKELQRPGEAVYLAMVDRWGSKILLSHELSHDEHRDGEHRHAELDRAAIAEIVFGDPAELAAIEALVHPAVKAEIARRVQAAAGSEATLIFDNPLLVKKGGETERSPKKDRVATGWPTTSALIVVDCPIDVAVSRLQEFRGFSAEDAHKRVAAQATREERVAKADFVIDNGGELASLDSQVEGCWSWIQTLESTS